jgi:hypothetical protein
MAGGSSKHDVQPQQAWSPSQSHLVQCLLSKYLLGGTATVYSRLIWSNCCRWDTVLDLVVSNFNYQSISVSWAHIIKHVFWNRHAYRWDLIVGSDCEQQYSIRYQSISVSFELLSSSIASRINMHTAEKSYFWPASFLYSELKPPFPTSSYYQAWTLKSIWTPLRDTTSNKPYFLKTQKQNLHLHPIRASIISYDLKKPTFSPRRDTTSASFISLRHNLRNSISIPFIHLSHLPITRTHPFTTEIHVIDELHSSKSLLQQTNIHPIHASITSNSLKNPPFNHWEILLLASLISLRNKSKTRISIPFHSCSYHIPQSQKLAASPMRDATSNRMWCNPISGSRNVASHWSFCRHCADTISALLWIALLLGWERDLVALLKKWHRELSGRVRVDKLVADHYHIRYYQQLQILRKIIVHWDQLRLAREEVL